MFKKEIKSKFQRGIYSVVLYGLATLLSPLASAGDFDWSGEYTIEGVHIRNSELDGSQRQINYGTHHLSLRPKIIAGDGLTIFGQFDLLSNTAYPNSQLGQYLGEGVGDSSPSSSEDSNALAQNQKSTPFYISKLYLHWAQDYGALIVGRAPLHFGLGMSYNGGQNSFDHWFDTRDLLAYRIVMGHLTITPMYGKVNEGDISNNEDLNDYIFQLNYENPETDIEMGLLYRVRKGRDQGSDVPLGATAVGGAGATASKVDNNEISVFALKETEHFRIGLEASFLNGKIGAKTSGEEAVEMNGFGVAAEAELRLQNSPLKLGAQAGFATGDDPDTTGRYEGFSFDRNYHVGLLMFNHPLGKRDVLRTSLKGGGPNADALVNKPDVESLSNAMFLAPHVQYQWTERSLFKSTLILARLDVDPVAAGAEDVGNNLGAELDFSYQFMPRRGVKWLNEIGFLFPGAAFDYNGKAAGFAYGLTSKVAISF